MNNIKFMVCPHDTASNPDKWYHFSQYLTQTLSNSSSVQFEKSMDFPDFHAQLSTSGLIYANPQDSVNLITNQGYIPVARSSNLFDEIVFVTSNDIQNPTISDLIDKDVITVTSMLVSKVGTKFLLDQKIKVASLKTAESWMAVVKAIFRKEEKYGFIYKDFYEGLNNLTKSGLQKIAETNDGTIHHNLLVSPALESIALDLQNILIEMHHQGGRCEDILESLGVDKFLAVNKQEILAFNNLASVSSEFTQEETT